LTGLTGLPRVFQVVTLLYLFYFLKKLKKRKEVCLLWHDRAKSLICIEGTQKKCGNLLAILTGLTGLLGVNPNKKL
jgi:hypothetical protein